MTRGLGSVQASADKHQSTGITALPNRINQANNPSRRSALVGLANLTAGATILSPGLAWALTSAPSAPSPVHKEAERIVASLLSRMDYDQHQRNRAREMVLGPVRALVFFRDHDMLDLRAGALHDHIQLRVMVNLATPSRYPTLPDDIRRTVAHYLGSLPGYDPARVHDQPRTTIAQHAMLQMSFQKILDDMGRDDPLVA
jgi:hypothetical protein